MLNAESASGPRNVNIGLPFQGDILILENDIPVVYTFWPQIPTTNWKYDANMGKMGLLSFAEGALTYGKVGYAVSSYDREAGTKFRGFFQAYTNNWGSLVYSGNVSGPIGKKGWGYMVGMHETFDRGNGTKRMYTPWDDRTEMFKAAISKKYKNGDVRIFYKHCESAQENNRSQPLLYKGNGEFVERPGFNLGSDSYVLGSGQAQYLDANTGISTTRNLGDGYFQKVTTDALYLTGNHNFNEGYKLTYSSMFMRSVAPFSVQFPISLGVTDQDQIPAGTVYKIHNESAAYTAGSVQMVAGQFLEPTNINTQITRLELTKKFGKHSTRVGLTNQFFDNLGQKTNQGIYYQTVEANPKLLDRFAANGNYRITDVNGVLPAPGGDYQELKINKTALYISDDAVLTPWLQVGAGLRIENEYNKETHNPYANDFIKDRPLITQEFKNKWNHVAVGNFVAKVTRDFGFLGDATYNDYYNRFWDYAADAPRDAVGNPIAGQARTTEALETQIKVLNLGAGVYYNYKDKFSLVSKVTRITKENISTNLDVFNPANPAQKVKVSPVFYDISTLGWTTDIVASPFKNFTIHYLLTLQNPQYKNYSVSAWGNTYTYDNNVIPALSNVLMEIDPSYQLGPVRIWTSLRYFGKQYGNLTNAFHYKPWWESFGGIDYRLSRNVDFKLQIVNFLNQKGIKGELRGADQITVDKEPSYIGRTINASAIRPRTIEFTVNLKL